MPQPSPDPFRDSHVLSTASSGDGRARRTALVVSLAIHAGLLVVMLTLPGRFAKKSDDTEKIDIVFYSPEELKQKRFIPLPEPPRPRPPAAQPEPQPEQPKIAPPEPVEAPPVARKPKPQPRPEPRVEPPPPTPKPAPKPKRTVQPTGFGEKPPEPVVQNRVRTAHKGSFTVAQESPAESRLSARAVVPAGSFGAASNEAPAGRSKARAVAAGSFGSSDLTVARAAPASRGDDAVISASFDVGDAEPAAPSGPAGSVQQGGFGNEEVAAAQPRQRKQPEKKLDTPVAITAKPKPDYTAEARRLRIEGEVVLEVTFPRSGPPRVLRVLGSLGYGLDEAAIKAAEKIEFEPARRDGRPVDHTATLRVVFRLA